MLSQLTPSSATAAAAITTAAIAGTVAIVKKLLPRKEAPRPEHISRAEFYQGMDALRDKIDARFLSLAEKIEDLGTAIHERLIETEAALARLDERTKN